MAQSLQLKVLVLLSYLPLTVEYGGHRYASIVVVQTIEAIFGVEILNPVGLGVPLSVNLLEVPTLRVVDIRRYGNEVQQVERCLNGYGVLHAVAHVLQCLAGEEVALLGLY